MEKWVLMQEVVLHYMGQGIKEWTNSNLWKTAIKKVEAIWFTNFSWSILEYLDPYKHSADTSIDKSMLKV